MGSWLFQTYPIQNLPFSLVSLKVFFSVYVAAFLVYLPSPHQIPLENNAFRQLSCHKILNINTSQRQHPQWKPALECKVRMENLPERKAQTREIPLLLCYKPTSLTHKQWDVHLALFLGSMSVAQVIFESTMGLFFFLKKTYFGIISDLQKSCKDGWKSSHIILHPAFLDVNIWFNHDAFVRTEKFTLLWSKLQILFRFHQCFHLCVFSTVPF